MRSDLRAAAVTLLLCAGLVAAGTRRAAPRIAVAAGAVDAVDLNRATASELAALPGLGAERARRIVARRRELGRFRSVDELLTVPGVGPVTVDRLRRSLLVVDRGDRRDGGDDAGGRGL